MKMYLYIRSNQVEQFLQGDHTFSIGITSDTPEEMAKYCDNIPAGEIDVDIDIDAMQVRQAAILGIEREETELRAVMAGKLNQLETRRQQLLAIEHKGDSDD